MKSILLNVTGSMKLRALWWVPGTDWVRRLVRFGRVSLIICFAPSLLAASAGAAPFVYVVTLSQQFGKVDLATGKFQPIGSPTPDGMGDLIWWDGSLLSLATTGGNAGYLVRIDPDTGGETVLRAITYNGQPLGFNAFSLCDEGLLTTARSILRI